MMKLLIPRYEDADIQGLPARAWVLTNSERMSAACPRRYLFQYIEGLKNPVAATPLRFGTAWHLVMETVYRYWMEHDAPVPEKVCRDIILDIQSEWQSMVDRGDIEQEDADKDSTRLVNLFEGWVQTYSLRPYNQYRVVGVEYPLASPIINPATGKVYRPNMPLIRDGSSLRAPRMGECGSSSGSKILPDGSNKIVYRAWPWYQIGRLDFVLQHRVTGALWAGDHKTSAAPEQFLQGITVDPQLPGYLWMLSNAVEAGHLEGDVVGMIYDVVSSQMQRDPAILKSGKPSLAKSARVPSWRFNAALRINGISMTDEYRDYMDHLRRKVDPSLYVREFMTFGQEQRERYALEIFGEAQRIASLRRSAASMEDPRMSAVTHPRVPICKLPGGFCSYRGPCFQDGPDARSSYEVSPTLSWEIDTGSEDPQPAPSTGELQW